MREKVPRTVRAHQSSRTSAKPWKARATRCFEGVFLISIIIIDVRNDQERGRVVRERGTKGGRILSKLEKATRHWPPLTGHPKEKERKVRKRRERR
jgi:hypothetical protein